VYRMQPPALYILEDVFDRPFARASVERMKSALPSDTPVEVVTATDLPGLLGKPQFRDLGRRMGMLEDPGDPALFLGVARFDGKLEERLSAMGMDSADSRADLVARMLGYRTMNLFTSGMKEIKPCPDHVCRPAWRLNLMRGCPHRCFYCGLGKLLVALVNADEFVAKLAELCELNPWQTTYLYDDVSEAFALEPEQGAVKAMAEFFGRTEGRYLVIHTKSANVDFLRDIEHNRHTIIVWSLTGRTQSEKMEGGSATMEERIEAARQCQEWGYTIRYKYKPIVPIKGWREEIAEMTRLLFERTRPDVISLFALAWMDYDELIACADVDMLDAEFVEAARDSAEAMKPVRAGPFPHDMRKAIYEFCYQEIRKHDAEIPVSLSTETLDMWRDLGPMLDLSPGNYPCGCGSTSTPDLRTLPCSPWSIAKPVPIPVG